MSKQKSSSALVPTAGIELSETEVLSWAQSILEARFHRSNYLTSPNLVRDYLVSQLAHEEREVFGIILLDSQHGVLRFERLFYGTIDSASVYPREVLKRALAHNAAALILTHNHPSGVAEPSQADLQLTRRLRESLALLDIRVLDHLVIGDGDPVSMAERGLL